MNRFRAVQGGLAVGIGVAILVAGAPSVARAHVIEAALTGEGAPASVETLSAEREETPVNVYADRIVWSRYDRRVRGFRLVTHYRRRVETLPVAPRRTVFDVDLGPGPSGHPVAVYSRCRERSSSNGRPVDTGCDVFIFDFSSGRERRVPGASSTLWDEGRPSIWRTRIAFARSDSRRRPRGAFEDVLVRDIARRSRVLRVPGGTRGRLEPDGYGGSGPAALDLRGTRLVVSWTASVFRCRTDDVPAQSVAQQAELWLVELNRSRRLVEKGCGADPAVRLVSPSAGERGLSYLFTGGYNNSPAVLRNYSPSSNTYLSAELSPATSWAYLDGDRLVTVRSNGAVVRRFVRYVVGLGPVPASVGTGPAPTRSNIGPPVGFTEPLRPARSSAH